MKSSVNKVLYVFCARCSEKYLGEYMHGFLVQFWLHGAGLFVLAVKIMVFLILAKVEGL